MKTFTIAACLLLVALASSQPLSRSTTPKYFVPGGYNGQNVHHDPNVNINDPNYAQQQPPANGVGGQFSSYYNGNNGNNGYTGNNGYNALGGAATGAPGGSYYGGGLSNSGENGVGLNEIGGGAAGGNSYGGTDGTDAPDGSVLNLDTDSDSEASMKAGVNATALGVVLTIIVVLGIFGIVAVVLIRQRRQHAALTSSE